MQKNTFIFTPFLRLTGYHWYEHTNCPLCPEWHYVRRNIIHCMFVNKLNKHDNINITHLWTYILSEPTHLHRGRPSRMCHLWEVVTGWSSGNISWWHGWVAHMTWRPYRDCAGTCHHSLTRPRHLLMATPPGYTQPTLSRQLHLLPGTSHPATRQIKISSQLVA